MVNLIHIEDLLNKKDINLILNLIWDTLKIEEDNTICKTELFNFCKNLLSIFIDNNNQINFLINYFLNDTQLRIYSKFPILDDDIIKDNDFKINENYTKKGCLNALKIKKIKKEKEIIYSKLIFKIMIIRIIIILLKDYNQKYIGCLLKFIFNRMFIIKIYKLNDLYPKFKQNILPTYSIIDNELYCFETNSNDLLKKRESLIFEYIISDDIKKLGIQQTEENVIKIKNNNYNSTINENISNFIENNNKFSLKFFIKSDNNEIIKLNNFFKIEFNFELISDINGNDKFFNLKENEDILKIEYDLIDKLNKNWNNKDNNEVNEISEKSIENIFKSLNINNFNIILDNKYNNIKINKNNYKIKEPEKNNVSETFSISHDYHSNKIIKIVKINEDLEKEKENENEEENIKHIIYENKIIQTEDVEFESEKNNVEEDNINYYSSIKLNHLKKNIEDFEYLDDILLREANKNSIKILLYGKPKSGKSKIGENLSKILGINFISKKNIINNLLNQYKEDEENAETDDDGNKIFTIDKRFISIVNDLKDGKSIKKDDLIYLFLKEIEQNESFGFILEPPFYDDYGDLIKSLTEKTKIYFTHTINLNITDLVSKNRFLSGYEYINFNEENEIDHKIIDKKQLTQNTLIRKKHHWMNNKEDEEEEEEKNEDLSEEEEAPEIEELPEFNKDLNLYKNSLISKTKLNMNLKNYKKHLEYQIDNYNLRLNIKNNIIIDNEGLEINEIVKILLLKIGEYKQLLPKKIENSGDIQELLNYEKNLEDMEPTNSLSYFKNIDCVEFILKKNLIFGKPEFAAEYLGFIFVFISEENLNLFLKNPKFYLKEKPILKNHINLAILGCHKIGKNDLAKKFSEKYGWKIIDVEKYIEKKYEEQKINNSKIPNFEKEPNSLLNNNIKMSKNDFKLIESGGQFNIKYFLPLLLNEEGIQWKKRPLPPKTPEELEEEKLNEEKNKKNKKNRTKEKNKDKKGEVLEDIELKDIVPINYELPKDEDAENNEEEEKENNENNEENQDTNKEEIKKIIPKPIKGLIFVNFPNNEEQINALKEMGIYLDRILLLKENDEEKFGQIIKKREFFEEEAILEEEKNYLEKLNEFCETFDKEQFYEIIIDSDYNKVYRKALKLVDVFSIKEDSEEFLKSNDGNLLENDQEPLEFGVSGEFCPVSFVDDEFILKGNEEFEIRINNYKYLFFKEEYKIKFSENINYYLNEIENKKKNFIKKMTKIFIIGNNGSGVKSTINHLSENLRLPVLNFKDEFFKILKAEKEDRKEKRKYFTPFEEPKFDEDENELENSNLEKEDDEFDQKEQEKKIINKIFSQINSGIINLNFFLNDEEKELIENPDNISELLIECGKIPEMLIVLESNEKNTLDRIFNKDEIEKEYNEFNVDLENKRKTLYDEKYEQLIKERNEKIERKEIEINEEEELEEIEIDKDELFEGLDKSINIPEKIDEEKTKYIEFRENELNIISNIVSSLEEVNTKIIKIDSNKNLNKVKRKMEYELSEFLKYRKNLFDLKNLWILRDSENKDELTVEQKVLNLLKFGNFKLGFGLNNPLVPYKRISNKENVIVYNKNIYFLDNPDEIEIIKKDLTVIKNLEKLDNKLKYNIKIFMIGNYFSGKTTNSKNISEEINCIYLKIDEIINELLFNNNFKRKLKKEFENEDLDYFKFNNFNLEYLKNDNYLKHNPFDINLKRLKDKIEDGFELNDEDLVYLIKKRINLSDVLEKGFILDGFPTNLNQAKLLIENEVIPDLVFEMRVNNKDFIIKKILNKKNNEIKFSHDIEIISERIQKMNSELIEINEFFKNEYNNFYYLSFNKSIFSNLEYCKKKINNCFKSKYNASCNLYKNNPFKTKNLPLNKEYLNNNFTLFGYYDCVEFKINKKLIYNVSENKNNSLIYKNKIYNFKNKKNLKLFLDNPNYYINDEFKFNNFPKSSFDLTNQETVLNGYDVIDLSKKKFNKGEDFIYVCYKNKKYLFNNYNNLKTFFKLPYLYSFIKLPNKLPIRNLEIKFNEEIYNDEAYLEKNITNIILECFNELREIKINYPTINKNETKLKLFSILLKIKNNNNIDIQKQKYLNKFSKFIHNCKITDHLLELYEKRKEGKNWNKFDENNFINISEEFEKLYEELSSKEKRVYFNEFIR